MTLLKHSEYQIIEQLRKAPDHFSMLSLILTSKTHRNAFLKVLNESHVSNVISVDIMGNVSTFNIISFSDEEMGPEGTGHNKALHLIVKSIGMILSQVLIDNGSAVNVCPLSTIGSAVEDGY